MNRNSRKYVDANALEEALSGLYTFFDPVFDHGIGRAIETVRKASAEDVRPVVHAMWIDADSCMSFCSSCYGLGCGSNYCPNCGAKMEVEDSDEVD